MSKNRPIFLFCICYFSLRLVKININFHPNRIFHLTQVSYILQQAGVFMFFLGGRGTRHDWIFNNYVIITINIWSYEQETGWRISSVARLKNHDELYKPTPSKIIPWKLHFDENFQNFGKRTYEKIRCDRIFFG